MTDVRIKSDDKGNALEPSVSTVNKKIEAFVEILMAKFQQQHDRILTLEQQVKRLEAIVAQKV